MTSWVVKIRVKKGQRAVAIRKAKQRWKRKYPEGAIKIVSAFYSKGGYLVDANVSRKRRKR